ncbi:MAG: hypothetical protein WB800_34495 [Streptosporangiaceae bacterium]
MAAVLDVAVLDFAAAVFGRAAVAGLATRVERAVLPDRADAVDLAADFAGLAVRRALAPVVRALAVVVRALAVVAGLAEDRDLLALDFGAAAGIALAVDIVLAAAVSDFAAVVMAFVAVFIACMAVDIVLAEDVALVAAAVILLAADVTLVAADETVRAATCADGVLLLAVVRLALVVVVLVVALFFGRLAVRLGALPLVDRVRALAGVRRAALRAVVRAGTDLPPV